MREVLFLGIRTKTGNWVTGGIKIDQDGDSLIVGPGYEFLVDPKTVCQYTGKRDKNGRRIWEGDYYFNSVGRKNTIKWCGTGFEIVNQSGHILAGMLENESDEIEVAGNIFDGGSDE